jgi:1-aminocyclopropane-1-carboxylate deaminase/D-cysteine desulfhydrase-like pyridoxal-dependent ACC family enzyme
MMNDHSIHVDNVRVDTVNFLSKFHTRLDVLRLDLVHPVISGNKWFKLKEYLSDANAHHKKIIATFGGTYSNHIVATAAAAKQSGFKSLGIIRGERPAFLFFTLNDAVSFGMELYFISREDYKKKTIPHEIFDRYEKENICLINEGGYGHRGMEVAKDILKQIDSSPYTHIISAVGTGTTLAGLVEASSPDQKIIGISVLKNNYSLEEEIGKLISEKNKNRLMLIHNYHFGGYAKYQQKLIDFMNEWYENTGIPSDFVYTGKLFFAVYDLIEKKFFSPNNKVLIIHSGGLQGNRSLPKGTLIF